MADELRSSRKHNNSETGNDVVFGDCGRLSDFARFSTPRTKKTGLDR